MAKKRRKSKDLTLSGLVIAGLFAVGAHYNIIPGQQTPSTPATQTQRQTGQKQINVGEQGKHPTEAQAKTVLTPAVAQQLQNPTFNGSGAFVVNQNKTDLDASVSAAPYVDLAPLDHLKRPGVANAWLNKSTREYRKREDTGNHRKIEPIGWHQMKIGGSYGMLYNRGHSIAYALAGKVRGFDASEANPRNITTQTAWANQASNGNDNNTGQNYYESLVRKALDQNQRVRYRVTPRYDGDNVVPSGSQLEAKSANGQLEFNVFIPNVQPGVVIDYRTGQARPA